MLKLEVYKFKCTNGVMKYFRLLKSGKSVAIKGKKAKQLVKENKALWITPFWV